ncbi:melanoregulin-like isoform X2 [Ptychodera flava]|uniref:melanoregulin-like isoform X2 n=1 Tax=Ptychodera flava TaxID=63121 RepID=UPI00396A0A13
MEDMEAEPGLCRRIMCCGCFRQTKKTTYYVEPSQADERTALLSSYPPPMTVPQLSNGSSNGLEYSDERNHWNEPFDPSHTECEEDMTLFKLLQKQQNAHPGSPEWMQCNLEINQIRQRRMDVQERWKVVLRGLGFIDEVESGIMSPISEFSKSLRRVSVPSETRLKTQELLDKLTKESAIFAGHRVQAQSTRYLIMMERLTDLRTAEDFVEAAIELYPQDGKKSETDDEWG